MILRFKLITFYLINNIIITLLTTSVLMLKKLEQLSVHHMTTKKLFNCILSKLVP